MDRRAFLLGSTALAAGCRLLSRPPREDDRTYPELVIDAHCHLMNLSDQDAVAFAHRHLQRQALSLQKMVFAGIVEFAATFGRSLAADAESELRWLEENWPELRKSPRDFYQAANEVEAGYQPRRGYSQLTGIFSRRCRNASRLVEQFPMVTVFTPSMVDFNDGENCREYSDPETLIEIYRRINLLTRGRFLPLVGFNPERSVDSDPAYRDASRPAGACLRSGRTVLALLRDTLEGAGFIGVKVHPSSGFAPWNNPAHGCLNRRPGDPAEASRRLAYFDLEMQKMMQACVDLDVPLLIHSGAGNEALPQCQGARRNNAPALWFEALDELRRRRAGAKRGLRVCFAHLAGGWIPARDGQPPAVHPWLAEILHDRRHPDQLYLDASCMDELFEEDGNVRPDCVRDFAALYAAWPPLASRLMYGSDWHMPQVAILGRDYIRGMASLTPAPQQRRFFGHNAARFYGLQKGAPTRLRLEAFYRKNGIPLAEVEWLRKI